MATNNTTNQLLGVVLLARHGDRRGFYQDPKSYTPSNTAITNLGEQQEFQLGQLLRRRYLNDSSPFFIRGINATIPDQNQIRARADAGGEGGVIYNSAVAFLQGLYPATTASNTTLANGTTIVGPLGGYQYIPVESVEPDNDRSLEGWTLCPAFEDATRTFYNSELFKRTEQEHAEFLRQLPQYLDGRTVTLENMWNIYDFLKVQSIHDPELARRLPAEVLAQAQDLANFHEYGVFSSPSLDGIGNIAGRTILPSILDGFEKITDPKGTFKILYQAISYKPFISLFNMTGAADQNPAIAGVVNFAAMVAFEVWSSNNGPVIRLSFKNGTADADFREYGFMGSSDDVQLSTFVDHLSDHAVDDLGTWCGVCGNTQTRGCGDVTLAAQQALASERIRPIGAGFLGAGLAIALMLALLLLSIYTGLVKLKGRNRQQRYLTSENDSDMVKV